MTRPSSIWREPGFLWLGALALLGFCGFMLLMPVVPMWVRHGGADEAGAGLVNGVTLLTTVVFQPLVPASLRRLGFVPTVAGGLLLLGLPSLGYAASDALAPVLVLSAVRGAGFAVLTVMGSLVSAQLAPPGRRGAAIGAYGLAVAVPNVALVPLSVPLVETLGYTACFVIGAVPVVGAAVAWPLHRVVATHGSGPDDTGDAGRSVGRSRMPGEQARTVVSATLLLLAVTMAGGALVSFLPQMVSASAATWALAALGATAAAARWWAGPLADRRGPEPYLPGLTLLTCLTMAGLGWALHVDAAGWVVVGLALVVGVAYGALQNLTMVVAFTAVARPHYSTVSAWWNVGFDAGTGLGSIAVGAVAAASSFATAVLCVGLVSAAVLPLAVRLSRRTWSRSP